jgi:hypothetical protein
MTSTNGALGTGRPQHRGRLLWPALVIILVVVAAAAGLLALPSAEVGPTNASGQAATPAGRSSGCKFWVAPEPEGDDDNPGTEASPWATLEHAVATVPDQGCTVLFASGTYEGANHLNRRFTNPTTFRSATDYGAVLENDGPVVDIDGGLNIALEGFELRHTGPETSGSDYVAIVDRRNDIWSEHVTFRNNVFHDSYGDDLLKIHNGVRFATVEGNVFYNQGKNEQHIDVNSVTDVIIQNNIFFNDFVASGRDEDSPAKHFIVVKDSNEGDDGLEGSKQITIRRNVFLNWQGGSEAWLGLGNDGKPYHEAAGVLVENNLLIGNSDVVADAAFGVRGAKDITINNNTVIGDLPAKSFAYRIDVTGDNPRNENIRFTNNIWTDPTGTMGADEEDSDNQFSEGDPSTVSGLLNDHNLYWNGGTTVPAGEVASPLEDDANAVVADPKLATDQSAVDLPYWSEGQFPSGSRSIRQEFTRLVESYGALPPDSPAVDAADPATAAADDILGRKRQRTDLGAFEAGTEDDERAAAGPARRRPA